MRRKTMSEEQRFTMGLDCGSYDIELAEHKKEIEELKLAISDIKTQNNRFIVALENIVKRVDALEARLEKHEAKIDTLYAGIIKFNSGIEERIKGLELFAEERKEIVIPKPNTRDPGDINRTIGVYTTRSRSGKGQAVIASPND